MEQFSGLVQIQTDDGVTTISLDGNLSKLTMGKITFVPTEASTPDSGAALTGRSPLLGNRVSIDGATGTISVNGAMGGAPLVTLDGAEGRGQFIVYDEEHRVVLSFTSGNAQLLVGAEGHGGDLIVRDAGGRDVLDFNSATAQLFVRDGVGREVLKFEGASAQLFVGAAGNEGDVYVRNSDGDEVIHLDGSGSDIIVHDVYGREVLKFEGASAQLFVGAAGNEGDVYVRNSDGDEVIHLDGSSATLTLGGGNSDGDLIVYDSDGNERIHLDGDTGDIRLSGADTAEDFGLASGHPADPGNVLVIQDEGLLALCSQAYDRKVAGVVSGAGGLTPGIILDSQPARDARVPIALNGKAYCNVDARYAAVQVGDLLTTSPTPGHAMKAADPQRAFGAVIGKALRPLEDGVGIIPILVSLQ